MRAPPRAPSPRASAARTLERTIALVVAVVLMTAAVAKGAAVSARYDPSLSPSARASFASAERFLGFGGNGGEEPHPARYGRHPGTDVPRLPGLTRGWMFGARANDLSDAQWRDFRGGLPKLLALAAITTPLVALVRRRAPKSWIVPFHVVYGLAFVSYLHGLGTLWILALMLAHFVVVAAAAGTPRVGAVATWISGAACLGLSQYHAARWRFGDIAASLAWMDGASFKGAMPRWYISFNLLTLRLISYGLDLHARRSRSRSRSRRRGDADARAKKNDDDDLEPRAPAPAMRDDDDDDDDDDDGARAAYAAIVETASPDVRYSLAEYVAHGLYPPLYLAGPTITFNAFASQMYAPQRTYSARGVITYAVVKFGLILSLCELWTHTQYANAIAKTRAWTWRRVAIEPGASHGGDFGPMEVGVTSLMVLNFMWLKFAVMWRFFRLWALLGGVEAPENMLRCVNNNSTIAGFWRGWHASYNKFLVRYLYIPLGGAKYRVLNAWVIFGFVGAWHDEISWRLMYWSLIFAAFLAPEVGVVALGNAFFPSAVDKETFTYRALRSLLGGLNVHVLVAGNMVGYVVGMDGLRELVRAYCGSGLGDAVRFFLCSTAMCAAAAYLGFEQRAGETRAVSAAAGTRSRRKKSN